MTAGCPCLLSNARSPQIRHEGGRRVLTWTCTVCGERNVETSEYPPQRSADVFDGGPRGPASVSDMSHTVARP